MAEATEELNVDGHRHDTTSLYGSFVPSNQNQNIEELIIIEPTPNSTTPCKYCNVKISSDNREIHEKQCADAYRQQLKNQKNSNNENDSTLTLIPCEYCDVQVNVHDLEWHTRQCADTYQRGINTTDNTTTEPMNALIPCEYCSVPVAIDDWMLHTNRCAEDERRRAEIITNRATNQLIPCEYCAAQILLDDWTTHTTRCAEIEKQRIETINNRAENDLIPCEHCGNSFSMKHFEDHQNQCHHQQTSSLQEANTSAGQTFGGPFNFPKHWDLSSPHNVSGYTLAPNSEEYKFVASNFNKSLPSNQIIQIERVQNRRWYRQYDAHRDDFIERYGESTEQWLFHGCRSTSIQAIVNDCFNRSHAVRCAAGQGIYFATDAVTSFHYTVPNADNLRHMFMARVLVGKTTGGHPTTRVCPPGYDTTGGWGMFVTYHDAQAYGEYLITFR